jgi:hypothetical protein
VPAAKFRKKPVVIEAIEFTGDNGDEIAQFTQHQFNVLNAVNADDPDVVAEVWDKFHSTWIGVKVGNFIIRGTEGEFYPHEGELFKKNYEKVE